MTAAPAPVHGSHEVARRRLFWLAALLVVVGLAIVGGRELRNGGSTGVSVAVGGSGTKATQMRTVPTFAAVELAGANDVTIHVGARQSVTVSGDDNLIPLVTTDVDGGTLVVGADRDFSTVTPMSVEVGVPKLDAASLTGAGTVTVDGVRSATFEARLGGNGVLRVSGAAVRVDAKLAGSGDLRLDALVARDATAVVTGSGRLMVHATRSLDAAISGTGEILYSGTPTEVTRSITGSGVIAPR